MAKMEFKQNQATENIEPSHTRLYLSAMKLRGLAFLLESKGEPLSMPQNMDEVNWGISLLLEGLAVDIKSIAHDVERASDEYEGT